MNIPTITDFMNAFGYFMQFMGVALVYLFSLLAISSLLHPSSDK